MNATASPALLCSRRLQELRLDTHTRQLEKGECLFREGDPPEHVYLLHSGLIKLYHDIEPGHQATARMVFPSELFGFTSLLSKDPYSLSAEAVAPCRLSAFAAPAFLRALFVDSALSRLMLRSLAFKLRDTRLDLLQRAEHDATSKVAARLLELAGHLGPAAFKGAMVRVTRADLGGLSGTSTETVSRVLGKLEQNGLIRRRGLKIQLLKPEGLQQLASRRKN